MHAEKQAAWKARAAELEPVLMQALPRKVVRQTVLVARHPTRGLREPLGRLQGGRCVCLIGGGWRRGMAASEEQHARAGKSTSGVRT